MYVFDIALTSVDKHYNDASVYQNSFYCRGRLDEIHDGVLFPNLLAFLHACPQQPCDVLPRPAAHAPPQIASPHLQRDRFPDCNTKLLNCIEQQAQKAIDVMYDSKGAQSSGDNGKRQRDNM